MEQQFLRDFSEIKQNLLAWFLATLTLRDNKALIFSNHLIDNLV